MMGKEEQELKSDVFSCMSRGGDAYHVCLTSCKLRLKSLKAGKIIEEFAIEDIFGCEVLRSEQEKNKRLDFDAAYVCYYLYPRSRRHGLLRPTKLRQRVLLLFKVQKPGQIFGENLALATDWRDITLRIVKRKLENASSMELSRRYTYSSADIQKLESKLPNSNDQEEGTRPLSGHMSKKALSELDLAVAASNLLQLKYVVIMNPKSGQGKTVALYQEQVAPILREAGIRAEVLITQAAGHASSFASTANFSDVHGIISLGGDGLLFEIVNGLRSRNDANEISKLPVGVIAGGSGNGLARSLAAYSEESDDYLKNPVLCTTLAVARGRVIPVNLTEVTLDNKKLHSFLSVGWGLLADIDIESEVLRAIGEPRFTLWSFLRLMKLRHYNAKLSYVLPNVVSTASGEPGDSAAHNDSTENSVELVDDFLCVYSSCQSYIGSDLIFAPLAKPNDGVIHLTFLKKSAGRACATKYLLGLDKGLHTEVQGVTYVPVREFTIVAEGGIAGNLVVDGERVAGERITARISPLPLNVFAL